MDSIVERYKEQKRALRNVVVGGLLGKRTYEDEEEEDSEDARDRLFETHVVTFVGAGDIITREQGLLYLAPEERTPDTLPITKLGKWYVESRSIPVCGPSSDHYSNNIDEIENAKQRVVDLATETDAHGYVWADLSLVATKDMYFIVDSSYEYAPEDMSDDAISAAVAAAGITQDQIFGSFRPDFGIAFFESIALDTVLRLDKEFSTFYTLSELRPHH